MTTKVTVDAHAGWPVLVIGLMGEPGATKTVSWYIVSANEKRDFYINSGFKIINIEELPKGD